MPGRRFKRWAAAMAVCLALPGAASAAGGLQFRLPVGPKNPSGLMMKIDGRGIDANGYRPLVIEVTSRGNKPLAADRQLRVVVECTKYASSNSARVSQIIELPEGSTTVKATLLVPQSASFTNLTLETYEGGEKLKDLSQDNIGWTNTGGWTWTEARPALLFIDSHVPPRAQRDASVQAYQTAGNDSNPTYRLPDGTLLFGMFPDINNQGTRPGMAAPTPPAATTGPRLSDTALLSLIAGRSRTEMLAPAEHPNRWLELSQYDVAIISLVDLKLMFTSHPQQLAALRDWLSTGPLLIVYGAGKNYARLPELERMLELVPLAADEEAAELRGWTIPEEKDRTGGLRAPFDEMGSAVGWPRARPGVGSVADRAKKRSPRTDKSSPQSANESINSRFFLFRPAKLGCVVAVGSDEPFPGTPKDWTWVFNAVPENHWQWFRRTGFSLQRTNNDYWKFLIPGVGEAPVVSFLLLVSLFAVVIGPLNYLFLGRARRLYLLLLTVPVGAAVVTFGLFIFALLSDGVGMRMRIRSYADLDQQTGRAAVWSRQSYYAGMAPSQGLIFPDDTAVFPLIHEPSARGQDRATLLVWDGDQQLKRGYLSSRTATQFMASRATATKARLVVDEGAEPGKPPKVENRLATRIHYLLLRDSRGDYFAAQAVPDKATKELSRIELAAAMTALEKLEAAVRPTVPHGYDPDVHDANSFLRLGPRYSRMASSDSGAGDPSMALSLLEMNIAASLRPNKQPLTPGTYVTIVETSPLVVTGVPRAREEASFHVIRARY